MIRTAAMAILFATTFMSHAAEEAKVKADPAKGKVIAETVCVACHGADGNSAAAANPILAGQGADYLYKQLKNFKAVDGKPAARNNAIMGGMVAALSDEDMKNLAAWFSSQKLKPSVAKDESKIALGQKIWRQGDFKKGVPACAGCHGPAGAGLPAPPRCRIPRSRPSPNTLLACARQAFAKRQPRLPFLFCSLS